MTLQPSPLRRRALAVLKTELRSTDEQGHGDGKARVDERRVHDGGSDGHDENTQTYEIDD